MELLFPSQGGRRGDEGADEEEGEERGGGGGTPTDASDEEEEEGGGEERKGGRRFTWELLPCSGWREEEKEEDCDGITSLEDVLLSNPSGRTVHVTMPIACDVPSSAVTRIS